MQMINHYEQTGATADIPDIQNQLSHDKAITSPYLFIYYPPSDSDGENPRFGQVIVLEGNLPVTGPYFPKPQDDQAFSDLARTLVRQLSALDTGIGLKSASVEPIPVRNRFIVSVEMNDGMPVISAIRQDCSGVAEVLSQDQARDEGISDIIMKLNTVKTAVGPRDALPPEKGSSETAGIERSNGLLPGDCKTESSGLREIARDLLLSIISKFKEMGVKNTAQDHGPANICTRGGLKPSNNMSPDTVPGMIVRHIKTSATINMPQKNGMDTLIMQKLISLEKMLQDVPEFIPPSDNPPEVLSEEDMTTLQKTRTKTSIHERIPAMVRDALERASRNHHQTAGAGGNAGYFGINIDENGVLRIDRAVLAKSLAERKTETVQYIQDFGNSFQDKIRYDFNPLAGLYTGGKSTGGILKTNKKHRADDEGDDKQKIQLEKRLNEVQMLLKSSYELKDVFMQSRSVDQPGAFDETDL